MVLLLFVIAALCVSSSASKAPVPDRTQTAFATVRAALTNAAAALRETVDTYFHAHLEAMQARRADLDARKAALRAKWT